MKDTQFRWISLPLGRLLVLKAVLLVAYPETALGQPRDPFDYSTYLREREFEASEQAAKAVERTIKVAEVIINGERYLRFDATSGRLYVPRTEHLTRRDLEGGLCQTHFNIDDLLQAIVEPVSADTVAESRQQGRLIVDAIGSKCAHIGMQPEQ